MTKTFEVVRVWFCIPCTFANAYDERMDDAANEPLSNIDTNYIIWAVGDDSEFSNRPCDGCLCPLAGDRIEHALIEH